MITSLRAASSQKTAWPRSASTLSRMLLLPLLTMPCAVTELFGALILMTSAPYSLRIRPLLGPARISVRSRTRSPSNARVMSSAAAAEVVGVAVAAGVVEVTGVAGVARVVGVVVAAGVG